MSDSCPIAQGHAHAALGIVTEMGITVSTQPHINVSALTEESFYPISFPYKQLVGCALMEAMVLYETK